MLDIGGRGGLHVNPRAFCMLGKHSSAEQHPPTLSPWYLEIVLYLAVLPPALDPPASTSRELRL